MEIPRPLEGFELDHESPTARKPVATGVPSTTNRRCASSEPEIGSTSVSASPSSQWACAGQARTTRVNTSALRKALSGASALGPNTVTDHESLSAGIVSNEIEPTGVFAPARPAGGDPAKNR